MYTRVPIKVLHLIWSTSAIDCYGLKKKYILDVSDFISVDIIVRIVFELLNNIIDVVSRIGTLKRMNLFNNRSNHFRFKGISTMILQSSR